MKRTIILLTAMIVSTAPILAQQRKEVSFFACNIMQYQRPVLLTGSHYEAYFRDLGAAPETGSVVIDETTGTFSINWSDGDKWTCKYRLKEVKKGRIDQPDEYERIIYTGIWTDEETDCMLEIIKSKSAGCQIVLRSTWITDREYNIETWKKVYRFDTGTCF